MSMDEDRIPQLDETVLYEVCPRCKGRARGCMTCWDEGIVVHECHEGEDA